MVVTVQSIFFNISSQSFGIVEETEVPRTTLTGSKQTYILPHTVDLLEGNSVVVTEK